MANVDPNCGFDGVIIGGVDEVVSIWPFRVIVVGDCVGACSKDRKGRLPNINKALRPVGGICSLLACIPWTDSVRFVLPEVN
jgi:hypothetical protein